MATDLKQFEYGIIGELLANVAELSDVEGTLTNELIAGAYVGEITLCRCTNENK
ncbi:unnamed protein product [marine sediment metagenome]|uniref:Uncharacterized protein n=1 Tax=marine sediment metagenome TaxID=412755 RepID=X1C2D5_9ZZZZ